MLYSCTNVQGSHWHVHPPIGEKEVIKVFMGIRKVTLEVVIVHRNAAFSRRVV